MGSRQTFLKLFLQHQTDIRAFVGTLISSPARRDDVFQDIALTLWQQFDKFDASRSFGAWARGIAANKVLQAKRNDRRFPLSFSPTVVSRIVEAFDATDSEEPSSRQISLRQCLDRLPPAARRLIERHYENRESCVSIARDTDRSVDAVYQSLCRIRRQLATCIEKHLRKFEAS